jgi:hypothetical protein
MPHVRAAHSKSQHKANYSNSSLKTNLIIIKGRAVAQAVSPWIPTVADGVRARVKSGAGFLRVLLFPLPVMPPIATHSSSSIILVVPKVTSGFSFTPLQEKTKTKNSMV